LPQVAYFDLPSSLSTLRLASEETILSIHPMMVFIRFLPFAR